MIQLLALLKQIKRNKMQKDIKTIIINNSHDSHIVSTYITLQEF